jgi:hypothetical protein
VYYTVAHSTLTGVTADCVYNYYIILFEDFDEV